MSTGLRKKTGTKLITDLPLFAALAIAPTEQLCARTTPTEHLFSVISMFSGCGGMDLGFSGGFSVFGRDYPRLPFEIVWANEINEVACRTYRRNIGKHIICANVWDSMDSIPENADVIIGGFPCQDISINGKGAGANGKRSGLYRAMLK